MNLIEALKTGRPCRRKSKPDKIYILFVFQEGTPPFSWADLLADDWETLPKTYTDVLGI